jgi:hypothetical membrane protein
MFLCYLSSLKKNKGMNTRTNGFIGITAVVFGTLTIIIMAALRTDGYNHFHKAVSELGSLDAPNKWVFNILGFIIPGILISIFSYNLLKEFRSYPIKSYPFYLLILSGIFLILAGLFPANMENKKSITTVMHLIGALGGGIFWLLSALTLWWQLKKNNIWKNTAIATFIIPFIMILAMGFVSKDTPGLSQRIVFSAMYLSILILAGKQILLAKKV